MKPEARFIREVMVKDFDHAELHSLLLRMIVDTDRSRRELAGAVLQWLEWQPQSSVERVALASTPPNSNYFGLLRLDDLPAVYADIGFFTNRDVRKLLRNKIQSLIDPLTDIELATLCVNIFSKRGYIRRRDTEELYEQVSRREPLADISAIITSTEGQFGFDAEWELLLCKSADVRCLSWIIWRLIYSFERERLVEHTKAKIEVFHRIATPAAIVELVDHFKLKKAQVHQNSLERLMNDVVLPFFRSTKESVSDDDLVVLAAVGELACEQIDGYTDSLMRYWTTTTVPELNQIALNEIARRNSK